MQKRSFFVLALLCYLLNYGFSQYQDPEEKLLDILSELDMTPELNSTGILINRLPEYVPFQYYRGEYLSDSTDVDPELYKLSYAIIDNVHINPSDMYNEDSMSIVLNQYKYCENLQNIGLKLHFFLLYL